MNENIEYKINAEELDLSNDLITLNDLEDIKKLKDPFLTKGLYSENEKFLKFSLFFIRKYLSSPNPNSKEVIKEFVLYQIDIIDILCELILKSNKKILLILGSSHIELGAQWIHGKKSKIFPIINLYSVKISLC